MADGGIIVYMLSWLMTGLTVNETAGGSSGRPCRTATRRDEPLQERAGSWMRGPSPIRLIAHVDTFGNKMVAALSPTVCRRASFGGTFRFESVSR